MLLVMGLGITIASSAPINQAIAVDTPLVAVYGPSTPKFTPPLILNHIVLSKFDGLEKTRQGSEEGGYHESLIAIKPSEVLEGLERLNK